MPQTHECELFVSQLQPDPVSRANYTISHKSTEKLPICACTMNFLSSMQPNINALLVCCFLSAACLVNAVDFKPGKAFPTNTTSRADLPLSSFINQRSLTTDWSLVVLLRGEQHYILNDKANRELLSQPVAQEDVVVLDDTASSFLVWRRQNPVSKLDLFWKSNPEHLAKALRHTSTASSAASSVPSNDVSDPPKLQSARTPLNPPFVVQPPAQKKAPEAKQRASTPSEEPTSSMPWSVIVILIVAATGLLWLLLKKRR